MLVNFVFGLGYLGDPTSRSFTRTSPLIAANNLQCSWPMTLNTQLPWTVVWVSLPIQLSNTSVQLVGRESVKRLGTTPLNSFERGKSLQRPYFEIRYVKMWIILLCESTLPNSTLFLTTVSPFSEIPLRHLTTDPKTNPSAKKDHTC